MLLELALVTVLQINEPKVTLIFKEKEVEVTIKEAERLRITSKDERIIVAATLALGTMAPSPKDKQIVCVDYEARCHTTRGIRPPYNGVF